MLRKILDFIRIIISIYLVLYIIIMAYFTINNQIHNMQNANIWGYYYMKVDDEYNKNDIPKDRYIILQMSSDFNVGDYVIVNENDSYKLKKVTKVDNFEYTLNYSNLDEEILKQIEKRNIAKKEKNYELADSIRDELMKKGVKLIDSREGTTYEIVNKM